MRKKGSHLTLDERCIIFGLKSSNFSLGQIAKQIGVDRSVISREIKRNSKNGIYKPANAEKRYKKRRKKSKKTKVLNSLIRAQIIKRLGLYHSPVQISGALKAKGIRVSHETIYSFIWESKKEGNNLYKFLRHSGKKYNKRSGVNAGRGLIPNRVDISERLKIVDTKSRLGDWEGDTIIGANHKGAIVSLVERKTKFALFKLVPDKTKESVTKAILDMMGPVKDKVITITFDNGKEFSDHEIIAKQLNVYCYFARPYCSWERGLNEHTNGAMRQFVPKKTEFSKLTQQHIAKYQNLLNNRPRKILNFNTPANMFLNHQTGALQT